tara:strand:+ start:320 stop:478 length:159 start_codon:yes stop_codon:yes gene_type:complete
MALCSFGDGLLIFASSFGSGCEMGKKDTHVRRKMNLRARKKQLATCHASEKT